MRWKGSVFALFRRRPEAAGWCYLVPFVVTVFFGALGIDDVGWIGILPIYGSLALLCLIQCWLRTLAGWIVITGAYAAYTIAVVMKPDSNDPGGMSFSFFAGSVLY